MLTCSCSRCPESDRVPGPRMLVKPTYKHSVEPRTQTHVLLKRVPFRRLYNAGPLPRTGEIARSRVVLGHIGYAHLDLFLASISSSFSFTALPEVFKSQRARTSVEKLPASTFRRRSHIGVLQATFYLRHQAHMKLTRTFAGGKSARRAACDRTP